MNRQLLDILKTRADYTITAEDHFIVDWFVEYLDHNSLWLLKFEAGDDPMFYFTNEAQRFHFSLSQMKDYYAKMKSGIAMDWEVIPFEYISKQ